MLNHLVSAAGLRCLLLIGATVLATQAASVEAPGPSGWYGEMLPSVRGDQVTGVFATARATDANGGSGPMFSCFLPLQGRLVGGRAAIVSWTPGEKTVIKGQPCAIPAGGSASAAVGTTRLWHGRGRHDA